MAALSVATFMPSVSTQATPRSAGPSHCMTRGRGAQPRHARLDLRAQLAGAVHADGFADVVEAVEPDDQDGQGMGGADEGAVFAERGNEGSRLDTGQMRGIG